VEFLSLLRFVNSSGSALLRLRASEEGYHKLGVEP
jgi:hypothetical protein